MQLPLMQASDPRTPTARLAEIASTADHSTRLAIAKNPNTSAETLASIAATSPVYAGAILQNPAMSLFALESNGLPEPFVKTPLAASRLLRHASAPPSLLVWGSTHADERLRRSVARNLSCPAELLLSLATDFDDHIRFAVAQHPNTPDELIVRLLSDLNPHVCQAAAKHPLAKEHLTTLGDWAKIFQDDLRIENHQEPFKLLREIKEASEQHPPTLPQRELFLRGGMSGLIVLACDPEATKEMLQRVAEQVQRDADKHIQDVWCFIVSNPNTPIELAESLVRWAILHNKNWPYDVVTALQNTALSPTLRQELLETVEHLYLVAGDARTPLWAFEWLCQSQAADVLLELAKNERLPNTLRAKLSCCADPGIISVISGIFEEPSILFWVARIVGYQGDEEAAALPIPSSLTEDDILGIRQGLAGNWHLPEVLSRWLYTFPEVREYLGPNPSTPKDLLREIVAVSSAEQLEWILSNVQIPEEWLVSCKDNQEVQEMLRKREELERPTKEQLTAWENDPSKYAVLAEYSTEPKLLWRIFQSQDPGTYDKLASNRHAPPALLLELAKVIPKDHRSGLGYNPNLPSEAFFLHEIDIDFELLNWASI